MTRPKASAGRTKSTAIGRAAMVRLFAGALGALDPALRVERALPRAPRRQLARVVAIGKAAPAMAAGAITRWGGAIERCLVVAPDGTDVTALRRAAERAGLGERIEVMRAAHPLPDARSVRAGAACLAMMKTDGVPRILVLVSGGASALACAPALGTTLADKRAVTRAMLASGATVQDINVVRKHLSRIKGGGLARAAANGHVLTIVASDVIAGSAADVGSGPSVVDPSSARDARRLLRRFAPAFAHLPLARTLGPSRAAARRLRARIVVSPEELARAFAAQLEAKGFAVRVLPSSQASAGDLAAEYAALAALAARASGSRGRARAFVRAAEPSVRVPSASERGQRAGRGGRSTHTAALVGRAIAERCDPDERRRVLFAALASDGVDGGSGTGGAIVGGRFAEQVEAALGRGALERAIAELDTGTLHRRMETALPSTPTGHNLADLHVLVISDRSPRPRRRAAR